MSVNLTNITLSNNAGQRSRQLASMKKLADQRGGFYQTRYEAAAKGYSGGLYIDTKDGAVKGTIGGAYGQGTGVVVRVVNQSPRTVTPPLPHPDAGNSSLGPNTSGWDGVQGPAQSPQASTGNGGLLLLLGAGLLVAVALSGGRK